MANQKENNRARPSNAALTASGKRGRPRESNSLPTDKQRASCWEPALYENKRESLEKQKKNELMEDNTGWKERDAGSWDCLLDARISTHRVLRP